MGLFDRKSSGQGGSAGGSSLVVTPVWGPGWTNAEVVGESNYTDAIAALFPGKQGDEGREVFTTVLLSREPDNKYDRNAVAVRAETGTLGYLPRDEAVRYAPVLDALAAQGRVAQTDARVYGWMSYDYGTDRSAFAGSVTIALPEPHMLFPINLPPSQPHALLPAGGAIQVTGEENYKANLLPWLNTYGEAWVHATLHPVVETTARTSKTLAEIRIDGAPVGRLTPKMSQDMLPAVEYLDGLGLLTCVRALVKGNPLKSDVVLYTVRAGELTHQWFQDVRSRSGAEAPTPSLVAQEPETAPTAPDPTQAGTQAPLADPPPLPPANWYPDPHGVRRLRYWDGSQWTEHYAD